MNVNSTSLYYTAPYVKTNSSNVESNQDNYLEFQKILDVKRESNLNSNNTSDIWKELSDNYNLRNASFEEMCEVSLKLYKAGEISGGELAILTFDLKKAGERTQQHLKIPAKDINLTPANSEGKRDWIAEFEARKDHNLKHNNLIGYEHYKRVLGILKKLDIQ